MSRALGDYQYKDNEKIGKGEQMVICIPDVAVHKRSSGNLMEIMEINSFLFSSLVKRKLSP